MTNPGWIIYLGRCRNNKKKWKRRELAFDDLANGAQIFPFPFLRSFFSSLGNHPSHERKLRLLLWELFPGSYDGALKHFMKFASLQGELLRQETSALTTTLAFN